MLEAIYWKPEFRWVVEAIALLKPIPCCSNLNDKEATEIGPTDALNSIRRASVVRNELKSRQSDRVARKWAKNSGIGGYFIESDRTPRHSLILKDVAYLVSARIEIKPHADKPVRAYEEQFLRRLNKGQCFQQPYFGCREYIAFFAPPDGTEQIIPLTSSLGYMLHDINFVSDQNGPITWTQRNGRTSRTVRGKAVAQFFRAEIAEGILRC